jgi:hypothetical protein
MESLMNKFDISLASSKAVAIAKAIHRRSPIYAIYGIGKNVASWMYQRPPPPAALVPKSAWERLVEWTQQPAVISCLVAYLLGIFLLLGSVHYGYLVWTAYGTTIKERIALCK